MPRLLRSVSLLMFGALAAACSSGAGDHATGAADSGLTSGGACASDKTAVPFTVGMHESADTGVTVAIEATPAVPTLGDESTWKLTVTDKAGAPVPSGTPVSMICKMTHAMGFSHGCPATIQVKETTPGTYEAKPVIFNMQGHWQVTFQVNGTDEIPFQLCVE
jgi:hypothetical protein